MSKPRLISAAFDLLEAARDVDALAAMFGDRWEHVLRNARARAIKARYRAAERQHREWRQVKQGRERAEAENRPSDL